MFAAKMASNSLKHLVRVILDSLDFGDDQFANLVRVVALLKVPAMQLVQCNVSMNHLVGLQHEAFLITVSQLLRGNSLVSIVVFGVDQATADNFKVLKDVGVRKPYQAVLLQKVVLETSGLFYYWVQWSVS